VGSPRGIVIGRGVGEGTAVGPESRARSSAGVWSEARVYVPAAGILARMAGHGGARGPPSAQARSLGLCNDSLGPAGTRPPTEAGDGLGRWEIRLVQE
jgi:hypothetical protein